MRKHQQHKYGLAATALSLLATVPVSAQVQELNVQRDTIPTYLKIQNKGIVNNALDVLNGNAAGVNVTSNGMDRMAQLSSVRVRGTTSIIGGNDPLVIIDGVTSDIATLSTIYPADIESFSVLKNAAETALYGSRGASGVIEVKTKKGTGKGFQISYETNIGMERMSKKLDMLSAGEYLATAKKLGVYANNGDMTTTSMMSSPEPDLFRTITWLSAEVQNSQTIVRRSDISTTTPSSRQRTTTIL